jgi:hypothetical protein
MKMTGIILGTTLLTLIVTTTSQGYVFAESPLLTTISLATETEAPTNMTGTTGNMTQEAANEYYPRGNASLSPPQVIFPTQEDIENYFLGMNVTAPTFVANSSMGNTTNAQEASANQTTYVVFQTELNGTHRIFLTMIQDPEITRGSSFSGPVELTPARHGNISHLQIAAETDKVFVVWQDYNSTTGLRSIFVSSSMDSGKTFRTYQASENNIDAFDPVLAPNGLIIWKQLCSGTLPQQPLFCPLYYFRW